MYTQQIEPKIPRLTKSLAEQYIAMNLGVHPQQLTFVKVAEVPREWKHACIPTGAIVLPHRKVQYYHIMIDFCVCTHCGKVSYHYET